MGDHIPCKCCGHYPAVCEDTISELNEKLAAATARFDEEETNKLRAIGLYDSCKKDLDAANELAERAEAKFKEACRTDPVVRLNNLCAALEEQKADSPYSAEAWDQITQENNELRKRVKDADRRAEESARDAEMYRYLRDIGVNIFGDEEGVSIPQNDGTYKNVMAPVIRAGERLDAAIYAARNGREA